VRNVTGFLSIGKNEGGRDEVNFSKPWHAGRLAIFKDQHREEMVNVGVTIGHYTHNARNRGTEDYPVTRPDTAEPIQCLQRRLQIHIDEPS
jgi:hypothetical protein